MFFVPTFDFNSTSREFFKAPEIESVVNQRLVQSFSDNKVVRHVEAEGVTEVYYLNVRYLPIEGDSLVLPLKGKVQLDIDHVSGFTTVRHWGITVPTIDTWDLPRIMARKFLHYYSRASQRTLQEADQMVYMRILDQVDWQKFSLDRALPHYSEGVLIKKAPLRIKWSDDVVEVLPQKLARAFMLINEGERFSAYAKFGQDNAVVSIEHIEMLT